MCSPFEAYKFYIALKTHFKTDSYDVFESNGAIKVNKESFEARKDKKLFERLSRQFNNPKDLIQYLVANFAYGNEYSLVDNQVASDNYKIWIKRKESITRNFSEDCQKIVLTVQKNNIHKDNIFNFLDGNLPVVLKLLLGNHITIETVVMLNSYNNMVETWDLSVVAESSIMKVQKLKRFVKFDDSKVKQIYNNFLNEIDHGSNL